MGWFGLGKKEEEEDEEDDQPIKICQGCGAREEEEIEKGNPKLKILKQHAADGVYNFLFCRKCYKMMKKGRLPPLIAQMQSQKVRR